MTSSVDILPPLAASVPSVPAHLDNDSVTELRRWIAQQRRRKAVRFVLGQMGGDGERSQPVNEWTTEEIEDDSDMAEAIYGAAVREAQALKTALAYGVYSARSDRPDNIGRWYFRIEAGHGWMTSQLTHDSPAERAILGMLMGHADAAARLSLGNSHDVIGHHERLQEQTVTHYTRLLDQAYARITVLEAREAEALVSRDQLRTDARDRELELVKENNKTKERLAGLDKIAQGMDRIAQLAPMILAKFGRGHGAELSPSENAAGTLDVLQQFIESIDEGQFPNLIALLRPHQLQLLELLHDIVQRRRKQQQESARSTPAGAPSTPAPTPTPETPAAAPAPTEAPTTPAPTPETSAAAPAPAEATTSTPTEKNPS
jgi:hypothetical protein